MAGAAAHTEPDRGEAILTAALDLFAERGFHGTSVPSVAERAGVAAGTIYHYFQGKEALVNALFRRWKQEIAARVLQDFPFDRPPREQFRTVWERMTDFALEHPKELSFLELHHHASYLDAESKRIQGNLMDFGIQMVERAQQAQALKSAPPALLMEFVNGAFLGVFRAGLEGRVPLDRKTLMDAEKCGWEAIRA
jgi:AcrR family transcriptional regulator